MAVLELSNAKVFSFADVNALNHGVADRICAAAQEAIAERGIFRIALSGGSTPKPLYELLGTPEYASKLNWNKIQLFLGDERCVAHDSPDSNFRMIKESLIDKIEIPEENVFPTKNQDKDPEASSKDYEEKIRAAFNTINDLPAFDLLLQGLGPDGHTASLFPGTAALSEKTRWYVANFVPKMQAWRLTLTLPVLNHGREVIFMVSGDTKASIVKEVLTMPEKRYPAQMVHLENNKVHWYMDQAAAAGLSGGSKNG